MPPYTASRLLLDSLMSDLTQTSWGRATEKGALHPGDISQSMLQVAKENYTASMPPLRSLNVGQDIQQLMKKSALMADLDKLFSIDE